MEHESLMRLHPITLVVERDLQKPILVTHEGWV